MTGRDAMRLPLPRMKLAAVLAALCAVAGPTAAAERPPVVHHDLAVTLDPANHRLKVHDRIRIPGALVTAPFTIALNADLEVRAASGGLSLAPTSSRVQGSDSGLDRGDSTPRVRVNVYR